MNEKNEILAKMKNMSVEDIVRYQVTAINTNRVLNVFGVLILFSMLMFPNVGMILAGSIFIFIFANMSVGVKQFLNEVTKVLESKKR